MKYAAFFLFAVVLNVHGQTIERSVVTSGAVRSSSSMIALHGSIGQPIIGISRGAAQSAFHGFWYRLASVHSSVERAEPFAVRLAPQPAAESARLELGCSGDAEASLVTLQGRLVEHLVLVPTRAALLPRLTAVPMPADSTYSSSAVMGRGCTCPS